MADVTYKRGQSVNLNDVAIRDGQILVTEDMAEMFVDMSDGTRKKITDNDKPGQKTTEGGEIFNQYEDYTDTETNIIYKKNIAIGLNSSARGASTQATGDQADASGLNTKATGPRSSTRGYGNIASGDDSTAEGHNTEASGWAAKSSGNNTKASGTFSSAGGRNTVAAGEYAVSDGWDTRALGNESKAQGIRTLAQGHYGAFAHGGYGGAYAWQSESGGYGSYAVGENSSAKGHSTKAIGYTTNTHGRETVAGMSGFGVSRIFKVDDNTVSLYLLDGKPSSGGALYDCIKPGIDSNGKFNTDSAFPDSKTSVGEYLDYLKELPDDGFNMPILFVDGESYIPDDIEISIGRSDNLLDASKISFLDDNGEVHLPSDYNGASYETEESIKELFPILKVGDTVIINYKTSSFTGYITFGTFFTDSYGAGDKEFELVISEEILNSTLKAGGSYGGSISNISVVKITNTGIVMTFNNGTPNIEYDSDEIIVDVNISFTSDENGSYETIYGKNYLSGAELTTNIVEENNATFSHTPKVAILTDGTSISSNHIQVTEKIGTETDYTQTSEYVDLVFKLAEPVNNPDKFMIAYRDASGMSSMHYAIYASENAEELFDNCIYEYSSSSKNGQENIIDISSKVLTNIKYFAVRLYNLPLWDNCTVISEIALYGGKSDYGFNDRWLGTDYTHGYAGYSVRATVGANANGYKTEAYGQGSNANGVGTKAISKGQTALGTYNEVDPEAIVIFGNGTDKDHRSNAFVVNKDGTAKISKTGKTSDSLVTKEYVDNLALGNSEFLIDQEYDSNSINAQSGKAVAQALGNAIDQNYNPNSSNAQSGKAISKIMQDIEEKIENNTLSINNLIGCGTAEPDSNMPYLFYVKYE